MNPELELAQVLLEDTRLLVTQERFRSAVSRAYYAAYHACIALREGFGRRPQNYMGRNGRPAGQWEHGIITSQVVADAQLLVRHRRDFWDLQSHPKRVTLL